MKYELLPVLSTEEFSALEADIKLNGVKHPIIVDENGDIIDGHHRFKIDPTCIERAEHLPDGLSEAQKKAWVYKMNNARRNLSPNQKKKIREDMKIVAKELQADGISQADIGALLGVAQQTISEWIGNISITGLGNTYINAKVVIPTKDHDKVYERVEEGETQEQVAADLGVTQARVSQIIKKVKDKKEKKAAEKKPEPIPEESAFIVEVGDVWKLGNHRMMCGNAYDPKHLLKLIGGIDIAALITDPPYGINYKPEWKKWDGSASDFRPVEGDTEDFDPRYFMSYETLCFWGAQYFSDKLPIGGWICWDKRLDEAKDKMFGSPFELAWFKSRHTTRESIMIRLLHGGVVNADSKKGNNEKRHHPTQKPVMLMKELIEKITAEGESILDPFAGVGSTLLACHKTKRLCYAMEIDAEYVAIALQRWMDETGVMPEKWTGD